MKNKINYFLVNFCLLMFIIFFFYQTSTIWNNIFLIIKNISLPFIIAFSIAYFLFPFVKSLKKRNIKHQTSCILILMIIIIVIVLTIYFSMPTLIEEVKNIITFIQNIDLTKIESPYQEYIYKYLTEITNTITELIYHQGINIASSIIKTISDSFIIIVLSIYFLFNMEKIKEKIKKVISKKSYFKILKKIDIELENYIKSFSLIILIESIEYIILYAIIGHPNYFLIGFLAGTTTIIPYIGAIATNILALVSAAFVSPKLFIATALIMLIVPIFDSYIRDPKIYHKTIEISPIKSIIILVISMYLFKFIGLIIAIPLYIILEVLYKEIKEKKQK